MIWSRLMTTMAGTSREKDGLRVIQHNISGTGINISKDNGGSWKVKLQTGRFEGEPHKVLLYYSSPFLPKPTAPCPQPKFQPYLHQGHLCYIPRRQSHRSAKSHSLTP